MAATPTAKDAWSAAQYNTNALFVYSQEFTSPILSLLDARAGERIIDFGCGSGELTLKIQTLVGDDGLVVGVDSSASMIDQCKANGFGSAFVGDVQDLQLPSAWAADHQAGFDAVFSNAALHWCKKNPLGVLQSAKKVLKPGGRLVVEMGGSMNAVGVRSALHQALRSRGYDPIKLDPWFFPSIEEYKLLLESAGFDVQAISLHPRITPLPGPMLEWLRTFCRTSFLRDMDDREAEEIMTMVQDICRVDCQDEQGRWAIMYCRLRVIAISQ